MTESAEHTLGDTRVQLRRVHRSAEDPLFQAARFVYSVERDGEGFEVAVELAPIFVHLLTTRDRARLDEIAVGVVRDALDAGVDGAATVRVSSDGTPRAGEVRLPSLLPLTPSS